MESIRSAQKTEFERLVTEQEAEVGAIATLFSHCNAILFILMSSL